jgi:Fe-S-cluster formation regulator IscX/YfhJ
VTCLKHLDFTNPKTLTFTQLIQMACELELEINRANQSKNPQVQKALENASEQVPHIIEWIRTAQKEGKKQIV